MANLRPVSELRRREELLGFLFISPWLVGFLLLTMGPMAYSLYLSFTNYNIVRAPQFIGLTNYIYILTRDRLFWVALERTAYYAGITVVLGIIGSLLLAVLLDQGMRGTPLLRTLFFLPSLTPTVALVILWGWILHPDLGVLNYLLRQIGLQGPGWLTSPEWAMPALLLMTLWSSVGGNRMVIFTAGLQGIPRELYEAAQLDGAGAFHRFWHVTLPLLTPTTFFNLIVGLIAALSVFTIAFVGTRGGPALATYFYVLHIYNRGFADSEMGYASALAWIFFLIVLVLTLVQFGLQRHWVYYEAEERQ
ncbi:MAG TPA: sugar ABC transporter permease [Ktedonobacteraceae bacterium]|jgi:multiple sugar transport system permease protein|nr:sugar ABC transporter permease [Ktedonobacteraceae bacterium]